MDTNLVPVPVTPLNVTLNPTVEYPFENASGQLFKKMQNCFYDLSTGQLGVLRASRDSYAVFVPGENGNAQIKIVPVTSVGLPIPAYAIRTQIEELKAGDLVSVTGYSSDTWLYYLGRDERGEQVKNPSVCGIRVEDGVKVEITLNESTYIPGYSVLCVRNLIGERPDFIKMFPMLALLGAGGKGEDNKDKLSKLILCMSMQQGGGTAGTGLDLKSMLPMLMLNGDGDNLLMTTMLLQNGGLLGK
ncbi:MAG TPA: hypothetical protein VKK31_00670 [Thermoanaerobaculia bacterium]|nr:hypothetical protein [Thermoanaerobaculia bacterium]